MKKALGISENIDIVDFMQFLNQFRPNSQDVSGRKNHNTV